MTDAAAAPLSDQLAALAEQVADGLAENRTVPTRALYAALRRAADEAVLLEARAGARDAHIHALVADLEGQCARAATAHQPGGLQ